MPRKPRELTPPTAQSAPGTPLDGVAPNVSIQPQRFNEIAEWLNTREPEPVNALRGVALYLYRSFPRIDLKSSRGMVPGQKGAYIERIQAVTDDGAVTPIPQDIISYTRDRYGSGRYRASLNDRAADTDHHQIAQTAFVIDEADFPPVIDPADLVLSDGETLAWCKRQVAAGVFQVNVDGTYSYKQPGTATGAAPSGMAEIIRLLERQAASAQQPLDMLRQAHQLQQELGGNGNAQAMQLYTVIMQGVQQQNTALQAQVLELSRLAAERAATPPAAAPTDLEAIVEAIVKRVAPPAKTSWVNDLIAVLPAVAPMVQQLMTSTIAPTPLQGAPAGPPQINIREEFAKLASNALRLGKHGAALAEAVECNFGADIYGQMRVAGVDQLLGSLLQSTRSAEFAPHGEALKTMLAEFVEYGSPQPEEETSTDGNEHPKH